MTLKEIENRKRNSTTLTCAGLTLMGLAPSFRTANQRGLEFVVFVAAGLMMICGHRLLSGLVKFQEQRIIELEKPSSESSTEAVS